MNLLQIRKSETYHFHNSDVSTVFDMSRSIYEEDYEKINAEYKDRRISPELGMVIGAITESQKLIDHAVESEEKGEGMNMCRALEKLVEKGRVEGEAKGREEGKVEGRAEGEAKERAKNIVNMYEEGLSLAQIARIAEIDLAEVEAIIKKQEEIKENAGEAESK